MATGKATTWVATLENLLHQNVSSGPVYAYVTLATVDQDNWPRGRTVVYRGMLGQSKKMVELHKGPLDADLANLLVLRFVKALKVADNVEHGFQICQNG